MQSTVKNGIWFASGALAHFGFGNQFFADHDHLVRSKGNFLVDGADAAPSGRSLVTRLGNMDYREFGPGGRQEHHFAITEKGIFHLYEFLFCNPGILAVTQSRAAERIIIRIVEVRAREVHSKG